MIIKYYVDTSVWLNLFKKEGNPEKGVPYWEIAKDFIEMICLSENSEIFYSGFILKELSFKLEESRYKEKAAYFKQELKYARATNQDYEFARRLELVSGCEVSFIDCIHIAICKRVGCILVTRDKKLLDFANNYIWAKRPEDLL